VYKAPFPWFGGKSRSASIIWPYFGVVRNYVEPFAGSMACLFLRPADSLHPTKQNIETVNDIDCYIANFWRAVAADPEEVAYWCDWPVNEADLHARHDWLVFSEHIKQWRQRMHHDPDYYDVKVAGWWVWGICQWIGGGWCTDYGKTKNGKARKQTIPDLMSAGKGVNRPEQTPRKIPITSNGGVGIHRPGHDVDPEYATLLKLLDVAREGVDDETRARMLAKLGGKASPVAKEICRVLDTTPLTQHRIPHLTTAGMGVHTPQKIPQVGRHQGVHRFEFGKREDLYAYFQAIADRLRHVRTCCGDWRRVVKKSVTYFHGQTAILLDPPYSSERQNERDIFAQDDGEIAHKVREWCKENGDNPDLRICLTGHGHEHTELEGLGWTRVPLKGTSGYSHSDPDSEAARLAKSETAWFSPHCVHPSVVSEHHLAG
jgi:hypothetical protein